MALLPVRFYRATLSWLLGGCCRFTPSCSLYAMEAIEKHGAIKGWYLSLHRLCRCQPLCKGGFDPVPALRCEPSSTVPPAEAAPPMPLNVHSQNR